MTRGRPKKVKEPNSESYSASVKIFGKIYGSIGASVEEAITNLKPDGLARGMSIISVTKGGVTQEKIFPRVATARLFSPSPMIRAAALITTIQRFTA